MAELRILDVTDLPTFERIPPCADPRFDHRTCDYWEDPDRGSKAARASWLAAGSPGSAPRRPGLADNPFAPASRQEAENPFARAEVTASLDPFAGDDLFATPDWNPFVPQQKRERPL